MAEMKIICHECHGATTIPTGDGDPTPIACSHCNSTGYEPIALGMVDLTDLNTKLNGLDTKLDDIMNKCNDIADAIEGLE